MKKIYSFFLLFFVLISFVSASNSFQVSFVIPGSAYYFLPEFVNNVFSDSGNNTIDVKIYLKDIEFPYDVHLNNSASVSGNLTDFYGNITQVVFNNTGSNGSYFLDVFFPYNGTYLLNLTANNDTIGYTNAQQHFYVGTYNLSLTLNTSQPTYNSGETGLITLVAEDLYGLYQEGGNATVTITYPDGSVWGYNSMTDLGLGEYFKTFIIPGSPGNYTVSVNFTLGDNFVSRNISFVVNQTTTPGGGGGGGVSSTAPYLIYVTVPEGSTVQSGRIKGVIKIVNLAGSQRESVSIYYYLEDPTGNVHSKKFEVVELMGMGETVLERELELPKGATPGEWKFHAAYLMPDATEIMTFSNFKLQNTHIWAIVAAIVVLAEIIMFIIYRERQNKKEAANYAYWETTGNAPSKKNNKKKRKL